MICGQKVIVDKRGDQNDFSIIRLFFGPGDPNKKSFVERRGDQNDFSIIRISSSVIESFAERDLASFSHSALISLSLLVAMFVVIIIYASLTFSSINHIVNSRSPLRILHSILYLNSIIHEITLIEKCLLDQEISMCSST